MIAPIIAFCKYRFGCASCPNKNTTTGVSRVFNYFQVTFTRNAAETTRPWCLMSAKARFLNTPLVRHRDSRRICTTTPPSTDHVCWKAPRWPSNSPLSKKQHLVRSNTLWVKPSSPTLGGSLRAMCRSSEGLGAPKEDHPPACAI